MEETIFQKIITGAIPSEKIYEDDHTFAFLDINPSNKGHTLVIPKKPFRDIFALDEETGEHLMHTVMKLAKAIKKGVGAEGVNVFINNGKAAGQVVFHLHVHLIPRFDAEEFGRLPRKEYDEGEEKVFGEKIRTALRDIE